MRHLYVLSQSWILSCPGLSPRSRNPLKYEQALLQNTKAREIEIQPVTEHFNLRANEINLEMENLVLQQKKKTDLIKIGHLGSRF